jgi:arginine decarboxylase
MALVQVRHPARLTYLPKSAPSSAGQEMVLPTASPTQLRNLFAYCAESSLPLRAGRGLKNDIHLETSSWFDISIIRSLRPGQGRWQTHHLLASNPRPEIADLINDGFVNTYIIDL